MSLGRAIILTDNLYDYALAAAARQQLAAQAGFSDGWPVIHANGGGWGPEALRALYGVSTVRLADLAGNGSPGERSRELPRQAPPDVLLPAFLRSLAQGGPLRLDGAAADRGEEEPDWETCERESLVVARRGSPLALPAAFYAAAAGKRFVHVDSLAGIEERLGRCNPASVVFVDELRTFTKPFLERMLGWSLAGPAAPVSFGVMAGHSVEQLSSIVGRLLVHRDFHGRGRRLTDPEGLRPIPVREMQPMEYYVVGAHGNEMHLRHQGEEVLCGAFADRPASPESFDCERSCRHAGRIRSSEVAAHTVFLLSCDAFTLGDGLAPSESNVMLNLLNGWTTSVLAPTKHVQGNAGLVMLVDALIHGGYSLGEIASRLNSVSRFGQPADPSYLVWGDPDLVVRPGGRRPETAWRRTAEGLEVEGSGTRGLRTLEIALPEQAFRESLQGSAFPAVEPLTEGLQQADVYFTLSALPARGEVGLIVFSPRELEDDGARLRLKGAQELGENERRTALERLRRISDLVEIGIPAEAVRPAQEDVLALLRAAAGYPRPVELVLGSSLMRNLDAVLEVKYRHIRRSVLEAILQVMATTRLWPSQNYSKVYPLLTLMSPGLSGPCPFCGNKTYRWLFQDNLTGFPDRHLSICGRCGIIGDSPAIPELELRLAPRKALTRARDSQSFVLRNVSSRPLELTWCLQFNQWQQLGLEAQPAIEGATLPAGGELERTVELSCEASMPDDVLHMHLFALTDTFNWHFVSQKVISMIRSTGPADSEEIKADA